MHRFFVPPDWIEAGQLILQDGVAHQVRTVLRMKPSQHLIVLDNSGWAYEGVITAVSRHHVQVEIINKWQAEGETTVSLTLYQSLLKRDNFEWVLQKCTELGVTHFVPLITHRTVVPAKAVKLPRWQRILTEAAEQCRRARIPTLAEPIPLLQALTQPADCRLIAWVQADKGAFKTAVAQSSQAVSLFIGPEGGFTDDEIDLARTHTSHPISLGPRTLRAETAAITATALILHHLNEL